MEKLITRGRSAAYATERGTLAVYDFDAFGLRFHGEVAGPDEFAELVDGAAWSIWSFDPEWFGGFPASL